MWDEGVRHDRGEGGRAGFERLTDQALAFLRSRTTEHWVMFAAGLMIGLILG